MSSVNIFVYRMQTEEHRRKFTNECAKKFGWKLGEWETRCKEKFKKEKIEGRRIINGGRSEKMEGTELRRMGWGKLCSKGQE